MQMGLSAYSETLVMATALNSGMLNFMKLRFEAYKKHANTISKANVLNPKATPDRKA